MKLLATAVALATCLFASAALAAPVTYTIAPVTLDNGAVLSGTFTYDTALGDPLTSVTISETGATPATYNFVGSGGPGLFTMAQQTAVVVDGDRVVFLFVNDLNPAGGAYTGRLGTASCFSVTAGRCDNGAALGEFTVVAAPAPVPTMSEWAMILFGTVLAGGAALYIQRRRFTT